jgi:hypothetical protein
LVAKSAIADLAGERVRVRGFGPKRVYNPSPDRFAVDLSLWER